MRFDRLVVPAIVAVAIGAAGCARSGSATPEPAQAEIAGGPADFDALLKKHVRGEWVDYAGWKANPADMARFDAFLRWQGDADVSSMSRDEKIAFYINAYNAACIKLVLDHYPVHNPLDIDGFFDKGKHKFKVGGEMLSNPEIEYDRLVPLGDQRAHFAIVCADRGWAIATSLHTSVVLAALDMAVARRRPPKGVVHHSDTGCQYTSTVFGLRCQTHEIVPSTGSKGDAYDNAMAESFFGTLEAELLARRRFRTHEEARAAIFDYIEGWYNPRRLHSSLGYVSPVEFERRTADAAKEASLAAV